MWSFLYLNFCSIRFPFFLEKGKKEELFIVNSLVLFMYDHYNVIMMMFASSGGYEYDLQKWYSL
jgi:hypothetical protein